MTNQSNPGAMPEAYPALKFRGGHEIQGLQIAKFFCAFLVVLIHSEFMYKEYLTALYRLAVPVFFMITGYFMPDSEGIVRGKRVTAMIKKIFIIFVIANGLYLAQQLFVFYRHDINPWVYPDSLIHSLVFLMPTIEPMWYLGALLQALIVIWLAVRTGRLKWCYIIGGVGLVIGIATGTYQYAFHIGSVAICWSRNFLTVGLPFIMAGIYIRRHESNFLNRRSLIILYLLMLVAGVAETMLLTGKFDHGDIYITTLPLSAATFLLFLYPGAKTGIGSLLSRLGREHSLNIYLLHPLVMGKCFDAVMRFSLNKYEAPIIFLLTLLVSIVIKWSLRKLKSGLKAPVPQFFLKSGQTNKKSRGTEPYT